MSLRSTAALMMLALAACGRAAPEATSSSPPAAAAEAEAGYRAAPQITGLTRGTDGSVSLTGRARPSSAILLASPSGARMQTTSDGQGAWRTPLGPVSEPILYGLSAEADGRRVQAEGYVAVLPGEPVVALLRAGSGALVLGDGRPGLRLLAVDIDSGGATVVSGQAPAGAPVRVLVDGAVAIEAAAGADGRFGLTLPKALPSGVRHIQVVTPKDAVEAAVTVGPIAPPSQAPYQVTAEAGGWRVAWITPGEGLQATILPAPAAAVSH